MVDSKENYKFDLGVKGLKWAFINGKFNIFSLMSSQPRDFPETLHTRRGIWSFRDA